MNGSGWISQGDGLLSLSLAAFPVVLERCVALAEQLAHAPAVPLELASVLEAGLCREGQRLQLGAGSDGGPQPHDLHRTVDGALVNLRELGWYEGHALGDGAHGRLDLGGPNSAIGDARSRRFPARSGVTR